MQVKRQSKTVKRLTKDTQVTARVSIPMQDAMRVAAERKGMSVARFIEASCKAQLDEMGIKINHQ